ncbi:Phosphinothricin N-acetyltransferase [Streptomyces sp. YIM 130001]|uniref:GNAT family N-acetyltransferase n=1 Tax=Streptomyces sp. YIM 130001 TaxID=2259644 RepID=UPI000E656D94|nr:GNAT family N-acetyltransferase [Streptomyces sp. YIM 130001]RII15068.1 Phosphinothricin N-acetyltransferase [Streptomyces sp. YIM 130001]
MPPHHVRPATPLDAPGIGTLKVRAWRAAYGAFVSRALLDSLDPADDAAQWADYLSLVPADDRLWVTEGAAGITGFCRTGPADASLDGDLGDGAAEIYGLYIDPARIGTGLGRTLFAHAVTDLERRGHRPLCVYAYAPNTPALRFYGRAGFTPDGTTRLDPDDAVGVPEVRLVKS